MINRRVVIRQKQPFADVLQNGILKNFAKFTGKYLCQNLFFNKVAGLRLQEKWGSGTGVNFEKFLRTSLLNDIC